MTNHSAVTPGTPFSAITPMTPMTQGDDSRPPTGWGLEEPPKGVFTEDELTMLTAWGRHGGREAMQTLAPAQKIAKKRRLLEWYDQYSKPDVLPPHGGTIDIDIKNMVVYLGAKIVLPSSLAQYTRRITSMDNANL